MPRPIALHGFLSGPSFRSRAAGIQLRLDSGLDDVHRASHDSRHTTSRRGSQNLQPEAKILSARPFLGQFSFLLIEGELQRRKRQVSENGRLVSVEQC